MTRFVAPQTLSVILCASLSGSLYAAEPMPKVQFVTGDVSLIHADGSQSPVRKGDEIAPGERLVTGPNGMAQIRAIDQGVLALRPDSECEFKPGSNGMDVALNHGQLRAVTDVVGDKKGFINVLTPDSKIAVGNGDVETGVRMPDSSGKGGESFSQAHLGVIKVDGLKGGALTLQPGQLAKAGVGFAPVLTTVQPSYINPVVPLGNLGGVKTPPTTLGPLVNNGIAGNPNLTVLASNLPSTINTGALGNLGAVGGKGVGAGIGPIAGLDTTQTKLPEVKLGLAVGTVTGGSSAINSALSTQPFITAGRVGSTDKTITPTSATITGITPTQTIALTTSNVTLPNNQIITVVTPTGGGKISTPTGTSNNLVLLPTTTITTTNNVVTNTVLNTLNTTNTINPNTTVITTPIKIGVLPKF